MFVFLTHRTKNNEKLEVIYSEGSDCACSSKFRVMIFPPVCNADSCWPSGLSALLLCFSLSPVSTTLSRKAKPQRSRRGPEVGGRRRHLRRHGEAASPSRRWRGRECCCRGRRSCFSKRAGAAPPQPSASAPPTFCTAACSAVPPAVRYIRGTLFPNSISDTKSRSTSPDKKN